MPEKVKEYRQTRKSGREMLFQLVSYFAYPLTNIFKCIITLALNFFLKITKMVHLFVYNIT